MTSAARLCILSTAVLMLALPAAAPAQMFVTSGKDTLRALTGVEVIVEPLPPELGRDGFTVGALREAVEARLKAKGVQVFASQAANSSQAKPYVYVQLTGLEIPQRRELAVSVQVQVRQTVRSLLTSSSIVDAVTWDSHTVVVLPVKDVSRLRDEVLEHVARLAEDWQAVH